MTRDELLAEIRREGSLGRLDAAARRLELRRICVERGVPGALAAEIATEVDGYGPLDPLMRDPSVCDILVNGAREVWVERDGALDRVDVCFQSDDHIRRLAQRLADAAGVRVDGTNAIADARLEDGSRLHVVLPPLSEVPLLSIRRFPMQTLTLDDLADLGSIDRATASVLRGAVEARRHVVVAGATGSGKTTLVNALLACVPNDQRVITIEETRELRPTCRHVVSLVARRPNAEGAGAVSVADLVRAALRMRPDRIVVGEVRGPEALPALQALTTGHEGSLLTIHARSAAAVSERLTALALQADGGASERSLRAQVEQALDIVVFLSRDGGRRRVVDVLGDHV